jgi:hypothetical protein
VGSAGAGGNPGGGAGGDRVDGRGFLTPSQAITHDAFRACAPDGAYLGELRPNGAFSFSALTQYDVQLVKKCMEKRGFRFSY